MRATDTHCHLERFAHPHGILARARESGVRIVAVTSRPSDFRMLFPLYGRRTGVRLALGLHPLEVSKVDLDRELALFAALASHTSYIGEIGLDSSRDGRPTRAIQERALEAILGTPGVAETVMTVHSRGAARDVVADLAMVRADPSILHLSRCSAADVECVSSAMQMISLGLTRAMGSRRSFIS